MSELFNPPFIELCRLYPLEHEIEVGDYYANFWMDFRRHEVKMVSEAQIVAISMVGIKWPVRQGRGGSYWLPRFDQLIDLLHREGAQAFRFGLCGDHPSCWVAQVHSPLVAYEEHGEGYALAAYKLLLIVQGRARA